MWEITKVYLKTIRAYIVIKDPKNWDFIFLIEYMSNNESIISNIIIFDIKCYLEKSFLYNNLNMNIIIAIINI